MSQISRDFNSITDRVRALLAEFPDARENDHLLAFTYWSRYDDKDSIIASSLYGLGDKHIMFGLTSFESIRRVRQKIQEGPQGKWKPCADVVTSRERKQRQYLEWVRANNDKR